MTIGLLAAIGLYLRPLGGAPSEPVAPPRTLAINAPPGAGAASSAGRAGAAPVAPSSASTDAPGQPGVGVWAQRLARAQQTLTAYRASTRYPPGARPLGEQPDQARPHAVAPVSLPLARADRKLTTARVTLRQDRMFLVGDERATLTIACTDGDDPVPCAITSAAAIVPPDRNDASSHRSAPILFNAADGGAVATTFQPSAQGFGGYRGAIRVEVQLDIAGEVGGASFDVVYSPSAPASFTGRVDEALRAGSLDLDVEVEIDAPGRYVITARVDDAEGRSFAVLSENQELRAGRQPVRLRLFGKLIRDEGARSPFRLRDLEGFRLIEDATPDRDPMVAKEGVVHTTKSYTLRDFSDAEWESDEKSRHLKELTRDVDEASARAGGG
ncbi:MAG: hypothetical protein ABJE95_19465 [Byssovorax sp.]